MTDILYMSITVQTPFYEMLKLVEVPKSEGVTYISH